MRYVSTRRSDEKEFYSFADAICSGYAPDGGLFVPETMPKFSPETLKKWFNDKTLTYPDMAFNTLRPFIGTEEISDTALKKIVLAAYAGFMHDRTVPVTKVEDSKSNTFYVGELYHGPTFCFKDLGMQIAIRFLDHFARKRETPHTIFVGTTGDTGPAALQAVADTKANAPSGDKTMLRIAVGFPMGEISALQRKQMTTVDSESVRIITWEGSGDDIDGIIKTMTSASTAENSRKRPKKVKLVGINSYNIGRPLAQMVHFYWTYRETILNR